MKRIGIIGLCFVAALAFRALSVASASATELLISASGGTFTATSGEVNLFGANEAMCTSSTIEGSFETGHLGKLTIKLKGCLTEFLGRRTCTGNRTGEPTGQITVEGPFHLNLARASSGGTPHAAILFLVTPTVVFSCEIGTVEVRGDVIGLLFNHANTSPLVPEEELLGSHIVFKSAKSTKEEDKEFLLALTTPENTVDTAKLESNVFKGGFSESGFEGDWEVTAVNPAGLHLVDG